ncbi:MAG: hypothetical protein PHI98_06740 [Eubacteriales bacterium]|nr:hypothetical protein [Eubacteriales bacterium]
MGKLYWTLRGLIRRVSPPMTTEWTVPFDGEPAVFCPNHAGAFGPIDMCSFFPVSEICHPWLNADVMVKEKVPAYVRQDYWWKPGCFFEPLLNMTLPYLAAAVLPPILRSVPGVPVYHDLQVIKTFRKSIEYLKKREHLIIFAQQPSGFQSHEMELNRGFLQICPMVYKMLGIALTFYPVHIDYKKRLFVVGMPIKYNPDLPLNEQEDTILDAIQAGL